MLSIDEELAESRFAAEPAHQLQPDLLFDRQWAVTLLERTMTRLHDDYVSTGRSKLFEMLRSCLVKDESALPYAEIATRLNLTEAAVKMAVQRVRAHPAGAGVFLEASGNMTFGRLPAVAATGVDLISMAALTHQARSVDLSMKLKLLV